MIAITRTLIALMLLGLSFAVYSQSELDVQFSDELLSVQSSNVSAAELATVLSDELDISVVVTGDAQTPISLDIVEEPLEKALSKISESHMLVRDADSQEIVELVLMMAEVQGVANSSSDQFLPSGSPVEAVVEESVQADAAEQQEQDAQNEEIVSNAEGAASDDGNVPAEQLPPMLADEQKIDPNTGLPIEQ